MGHSHNSELVPVLLAELTHNSPEVREAVVDALGELRFPGTDTHLMKIASDDENESVRRCAAVAMLRVRCPSGKEEGEDCATAVFLRNQHILNASEIVEAVTNIEESEICKSMIRAIAKRASEPGAKEVFQGFREPDQFLRDLCNSDDWQTRVYAIAGLSRAKDTDVTESLLKLLDDENGTVRREAAEALGLIGGVKAKVRLDTLSSDDTDAAVRSAACQALSNLKAG